MNTIGSIIGSALKGRTTVQKEEVAGQLGISRRTLDAVVKGDSNLTLDQISKLSDILAVNLLEQYLAKTGRKDLPIMQEPANEKYMVPAKEVSLHFTLKAKVENFGNFQNFLSDLRKLSAKYGYDVI